MKQQKNREGKIMYKGMGRNFFYSVLCLMVLTGCTLHKPITYQNFHFKANKNLIRITEYNVNWGHDEDRGRFKNWPLTLQAIRGTHSDVVLLEEVTPTWQRRLDNAFSQQFPYRVYHHYVNGSGLGFLSKYPVVETKYLLSSSGWYPGFSFFLKTPQGNIQFLIVHLLPTLTPHKIEGFKRYSIFQAPKIRKQEIQSFLQQLPAFSPTIIAGDFNEGDQGRAVKLVKEYGYYDALAFLDRSFYTWHWPFLFGYLADRFNHLLYTPDLLKLNQMQVLYEGGSDHYPLVADFQYVKACK